MTHDGPPCSFSADGEPGTMEKQQQEAFAAAVERKKDESEARSHDTGPAPEGQSAVNGDQHSLITDTRKTQDVFDPRDKNTGKGKKTADKWNQ
jgi:hypothetical protein